LSLPHAFPFRLVDVTSTGARLRLSANAFWLRGDGAFGAPWLVEATAQAAALLPRPGGDFGTKLYLAGVDDCRLERLPRAGETLEFELRQEARLGALVRIAAVVRSDGEIVGVLTLMLGTAS
jgi:hypothetical protein